jgi:glycosyltransferase involved in cell wall biosynthesis
MTWPAVSVVVPAYNAAGHLTGCLQGVLAQEYPDFEVIVVDDASTDKTPEIVRSHEGARLVSAPLNLGPGAARNRGVAASRGALVVFLDSDSIVDDRLWLAKHVAAHASPEPVLLGGGVAGVGRGLVARADSYCHWSTNIPGARPTVTTAAPRPGRVSRHLVTNNMSVRRSTFDLVGPFDERFRTGEDVDFCERALRRGIPLRLEPTILVRHRDRERLTDFLRCFVRTGKDRIPVREKHPGQLRWLLPRGLASSVLLAPVLAVLLWLQTTLAWWPYDKRVALYAPRILLAYFAMPAGIVCFFYERRRAASRRRPDRA